MRWAWRAASTSAPSCRTRCGAGGVCLVRTIRALVLPSLARPPAAVSRNSAGGPGASLPLTPVTGGAAVGHGCGQQRPWSLAVLWSAARPPVVRRMLAAPLLLFMMAVGAVKQDAHPGCAHAERPWGGMRAVSARGGPEHPCAASDGACRERQAAAELGNTDVGAELDADAAPAGDAGEAAAAALAAAVQPEREVHSFEIDPTQVRGRRCQALRAG